MKDPLKPACDPLSSSRQEPDPIYLPNRVVLLIFLLYFHLNKTKISFCTVYL